jgi:hypothetical protein
MKSSTDQVEATANRLRDDLMGTLRELDRRRARATDIRFQVQKHAGAILGVCAGLGLVAGLSATVMVVRRRAQKRRKLQRWVTAIRRTWAHPERLATRANDRSMPTELLRRVTMAAAVALATQVSKRAVQEVWQRPDDVLVH